MHPDSSIGIRYLREIWSYYDSLRRNQPPPEQVDWKYTVGVFNALGIGVEPTIKYLLTECTSLADFERWIESQGGVSRAAVEHFNAVTASGAEATPAPPTGVFGEEDLAHWEREGYLVLRGAIPKEDCAEAVRYICDAIGADLNAPRTWYTRHPLKQGIMVQLFNGAILDRNRYAPRLKAAFQQLWNRKELLASMDRVSFNPPETEFYHFPGPKLHWDVSLKRPIPFGIQGLLYLTDTAADQGAFTVVPGFHRRIEQWLDGAGADPRGVNLLEHFGDRPIAAEAGDFIFWDQRLPHGSRPNRATRPRIVQYINYQPLDFEYQAEWV